MSSALTARGSTRAWRKIQSWILERDGHICRKPVDGHICGEPATTAGHIIRREHGGGDGSDNLRAECSGCNFGERPTPRVLTLATLTMTQALIVRLLDAAGLPTTGGRRRAVGALKRAQPDTVFRARDVDLACIWRRVRGPLTRA